MLKVFFGKEEKGKKEELEKTLLNFDGGRIKFDSDNYNKDEIEELAKSESLFGEKNKVLLKNILSEGISIEENLFGEMKKSSSLFLFSEEKLLKKQIDVFKKLNLEIKEFKKIGNKKKKAYVDEPFNIFLLTDALGERNKKKLWILFHGAIRNGSPIEEIHGLLNWQVKNMIIVKTMKENSGLHPFVLQKTQKFTENYSLGELKNLSSELIKHFHEGNRDIEFALEKFILNI